MEEIIYSQNNNSTISCYSMDFSGINKQNAHGGRNVMLRCLSEGVDIFLKSAERQGGANRRFKASGRCHGWQLEPCPYGLEPLYHFSIENSHPEMRHLGVMFRSSQTFVGAMATLPYEPCTQFINVSQRALPIYELTAVECVRWTHGIKIERNNLLCEQAPTEVFRSIFAWLVTFNSSSLSNGRNTLSIRDA